MLEARGLNWCHRVINYAKDRDSDPRKVPHQHGRRLCKAEESDPATLRALPADMAAESQDLGATIITSLGYRDLKAIDSRLGLKPSDKSEIQRSAGVSADTRRGVSSLVKGDLWLLPVEEGGRSTGNRDAAIEPSGDVTDSVGSNILRTNPW